MEIGGSSSRGNRPAYRFIGIYLQLAGHGLPNFDLITRNTRALVNAVQRLYLHRPNIRNIHEQREN